MTWKWTYDGIDISASVYRQTFTSQGQASKGQPTICSLDVADDAGTFYPASKKIVIGVEQSTAARFYRGRVDTVNYQRGDVDAGIPRRVQMNMADVNLDLVGIIVDQWVRPAETDVARVTAVMTTFLGGAPRASTSLASTYLSGAGAVLMDAQTYTSTTPGGVIQDCADAAGKEFFVTVDEQLFYDSPLSTAYAAGLSITDVSPNLSTSFPPIVPPADAGTRDGSQFISGAKLAIGPGPTDSVYQTVPAAVTLHDWWEEVVTDGRGTSTANAAIRLASMLTARQVETKQIKCSLKLTAAQLALIKWGQTLTFRSAAAGELTPITLRVAMMSVSEVGFEEYLVDLELGNPTKYAQYNFGSPLPKVPSGGGSGTGGGGSGGGCGTTDSFNRNDTPAVLHVGNLGTSDTGIAWVPRAGAFAGGYIVSNQAIMADPSEFGTGAQLVLAIPFTAAASIDFISYADVQTFGLKFNGSTIDASVTLITFGGGTGVQLFAHDNLGNQITASSGPSWPTAPFTATLTWNATSITYSDGTNTLQIFMASAAPGPIANLVDAENPYIQTRGLGGGSDIGIFDNLNITGVNRCSGGGGGYGITSQHGILGTGDGARTAWTIPGGYIVGSVAVMVSGDFQNVTELNPSTGTIVVNPPATAGKQVNAFWSV